MKNRGYDSSPFFFVATPFLFRGGTAVTQLLCDTRGYGLVFEIAAREKSAADRSPREKKSSVPWTSGRILLAILNRKLAAQLSR